MVRNFLNLAKTGRNHWWRYILAICTVLAFWQLIGLIPVTTLITFLRSVPKTSQDPGFEGVVQLLLYIAINLSFVCFLAGLYIAVKFIHRRHFITLLTPKNKISWGRLFQGLAVIVTLVSLAGLIESIIKPGTYQLTFHPLRFFVFLPIALILTSIQAGVEELFFRGYLMQGMYLKSRNIVIPIIGSSILFMLPHLLNPEAKSSFLLATAYYLAFGLFHAIITVKDNRLELAMGAHIGNNLYVALVANYVDTAIPAPSIFTIQSLDPVYNFASSIVIFVLFYLFFFRKRQESLHPTTSDSQTLSVSDRARDKSY